MYLTERDWEREHKQGEWEREKQASHRSREPDVGLDPRALGPWSEPKAGLNNWATQVPWPISSGIEQEGFFVNQRFKLKLKKLQNYRTWWFSLYPRSEENFIPDYLNSRIVKKESDKFDNVKIT